MTISIGDRASNAASGSVKTPRNFEYKTTDWSEALSNNPGKKGKPAPWVKKESEHRRRALDEFNRANHPAYDEWRTKRTEAANIFRKEAETKYPGVAGVSDAIKETDKKVGKWDKKNPTPLTWEESRRLEAEFESQYESPDFS
jgi:integrase